MKLFKWKGIKTQTTRIAALLSQTLNTLFLGGHHNMTVSARSYLHGGLPERVINFIFFWEKDHCRKSFLRDVTYSREILDIFTDK